ncbi:hypothetical protein ABZ883_04640 [Streptomyces sp. NPDC046977]|uniref:hypothetical protein n=1 Tax=Streptomyces sp. NPDC046977 TaxID=3154703 RepID=UPI00340060FC
MTGPEHYSEAERLAGRAHHYTYGDGADPAVGLALAAEAQVHATLAVAAAVALTQPVVGQRSAGHDSPAAREEWVKAAGRDSG